MPRIVILFVLAIAALPSPVRAEPDGKALSEKDKKRGRAMFERGKQLTAEGRYAEALVELTRGYELTGRPLFLFNMAECARALKDVVQARELYERYLAAESGGPFANAARARLVELTPTPPPAPVEPAPAPVVIPPPREVAEAAPAPKPVVATQPRERSESHTVRNVAIVTLGLALIAGSVAIYVVTRSPECGAGCVDLR